MRPGIETLRRLHVFAALSAEQLQILNELGDLARLGPNHDVLMEGYTPSDLIFRNCPGTPRWCPGTPSERRSVGEFALEKLAFRSLARPQAAFCGTTWAVTIFLISGAAVAM